MDQNDSKATWLLNVEAPTVESIAERMTELEALCRKAQRAADDAAALTAEAAQFARFAEDTVSEVRSTTKVITALTAITLACALMMLAIMAMYAGGCGIFS